MSTSNVAAPPETPDQEAGSSRGRQEGPPASEARWAIYLIAPTIVMLAIVIGYPVVSAIIMSFQKDAGLDPATGLFVQGGFAGFQNYAHWLFQQCPDPTARPSAVRPATSARSSGTPSSSPSSSPSTTVILETILGIWFAIIMNRTFRGRGLVRAADPGAVGHPDRRHREALVLHLLRRRRRQRRARTPTSSGPATSGPPGSRSSSPTPGRPRRSWRC